MNFLNFRTFFPGTLNFFELSNFHRTFTVPFSNNFQKNAAFRENPEKNWPKFSNNSAKFWQILQNFLQKLNFAKNQHNFQQFLTKKLRLENGFDLRSWLSVSSPLRSVGTPSPVSRGSLLFCQTRKQPRTLYNIFGTLLKGLASQEIRKKELRLSANS